MMEKFENKSLDDKELKNKKVSKKRALFVVPVHFDGSVRHGFMDLSDEQYKRLQGNGFVAKGKILLYT